MPIPKVALLLLFLSFAAHADDLIPIDHSTDTFGRLLAKQAQLLDSEMDMRIRQNENQGTAAIPSNANPLPGAKQEVNELEPTVEAIWGLAGKEVAEINYKGRRVPVSMQEPFISKVDGWKLESIEQYQIQLVRTEGRQVLQRKTIMLDWMGGQGSQAIISNALPVPAFIPPSAPITPAINPAAMNPASMR
ncbi:hypothetical protein IFR09_22745 [Pseudomonas syringae]|uniref:hypothetical protein n=1 Tax=Pseudomonas ovata TaxID=1839709 RepID=UPI00126024D8|nr:hypothetical protein [Pseudomonas ovata]MBD8792702.1 hypothetical protein [Pseudomonas syringae]MBD8803168.1 hypothetical protein [Pseudomonas syringae]MBD8813988.1 hypothetical protein [Pseudomonas syringae]